MNKKYEYKKYELVDVYPNDVGAHGLYRIRALRDFGDVKAGDIGGLVSSEENLLPQGNCWIYNDARVYGNARVRQNATVRDAARIHEYAKISGNAKICDTADVYGHANITADAELYNRVRVYGNAEISGEAVIKESAIVRDSAMIYGRTVISGSAIIHGNSQIFDYGSIKSDNDYMYISGIGSENRTTTAYRTYSDKIYVTCGCFDGTLDDFIWQVNHTYQKDEKYWKEYNLLIEIIKTHFDVV